MRLPLVPSPFSRPTVQPFDPFFPHSATFCTDSYHCNYDTMMLLYCALTLPLLRNIEYCLFAHPPPGRPADVDARFDRPVLFVSVCLPVALCALIAVLLCAQAVDSLVQEVCQGPAADVSTTIRTALERGWRGDLQVRFVVCITQYIAQCACVCVCGGGLLISYLSCICSTLEMSQIRQDDDISTAVAVLLLEWLPFMVRCQ